MEKNEKKSTITKKRIKEFVSYVNEGKEVLHDVTTFAGHSNGIEVDVAFQYNDQYSESILSFVNNVRTKDGGTHEVGFKTAMTRVLMNMHVV